MPPTGADMARFMIAHLQNGEYRGHDPQPETAELMHSRSQPAVLGLHGMALGFYEETANGHRVIGHGGDTAVSTATCTCSSTTTSACSSR